jgi:hypothetical protein
MMLMLGVKFVFVYPGYVFKVGRIDTLYVLDISGGQMPVPCAVCFAVNSERLISDSRFGVV